MLPDVKDMIHNSSLVYNDKVQKEYEKLMNYFKAQIIETSNKGYCGFVEEYNSYDAIKLEALKRCKREIKNHGYRCNMGYQYNPRTKNCDGIYFKISWRKQNMLWCRD